MDSNSNYYIILDLDPEIDNWDLIEKQIQQMQQVWSLAATLPNDDKAKENLALIGKIRTTLHDPQQRKVHAAEAKIILGKRRANAVNKINSHIKIIKTRGTCSQKTFRQLVDKYKILSEQEIKRMLTQAGIGIIDEPVTSNSRSPMKEKIPSSAMRQIREELKEIEKIDLYDFLGLPANTSYQQLYKIASSKYTAAVDIHTPNSNRVKKLAGYCQAYFRTPENKEKYDLSLADEKLAELDDDIRIAGNDSPIGPDEMDALVRQARTLGVKATEARAYIENYASSHRIAINKSGKLPAETLLSCGTCRTLSDGTNTDYCKNCGKPLKINCLVCGALIPTQDQACTKCGASVGDSLMASDLFSEADQLYHRKKYVEAVQRIEEALDFRAEWHQALDLKQKIQEEQQAAAEATKKAAAEKEKVFIEAKRNLETLVYSNQLESAQVAMIAFQASYPQEDVTKLSDLITQGIGKCNLLSQEAQDLLSKLQHEQAFEKAAEALKVCHDHTQARQIYNNCPPAPPTEAKAVVSPQGETIKVTWKESPSKSAQYIIMRERKHSDGRNEGIKVAQEKPGVHQWVDADPPPGVPFKYSIYTKRGEMLSESSADTGFVFVTREVKNLTVEAGDGAIWGQWQTPDNAKARVSLREADDDQTNVEILANRHFVVRSLKNDVPYTVQILCEYVDDIGQPVMSHGITQKITPRKTPLPIDNLVFTETSAGLEITWSSPDGNQVYIYRHENPSRLAYQSPIPLSDLGKVGTLVAGHASDNVVTDTAAVTGVIYYTPVSANGNIGIIGRTQTYSHIPSILDLDIVPDGKYFRAKWRWPEHISEVKISWHYDDWLQSLAEEEMYFTIASLRSGQPCIIPADNGRPCTITLQNTFGLEDNKVFGNSFHWHYKPTTGPMQAKLSYQIMTPLFGFLFRKKVYIKLTCTQGLATNLDLVLVGKRHARCFQPSDGTTLNSFSRLSLSAGQTLRLMTPYPKYTKDFVVTLLPINGWEQIISIEHPATNKSTLR